MRTDIIKVRVFVEGIRVPYVNQVQVQTYANEVSQATFSLPPIVGFETEELKRARVHIFWSDIDTRNSVDEDDWPLLFEGEIVADSYSKSPTGRQQMFHCAGYHTYWEQVMQYYWDPSHANPSQPPWAPKLALALGNERIELEANNAGINLRGRLIQFLRENADLSYSSIVKKVFGDAMAVNFFYSEANKLLKLDSRFVTPQDPNIERLLGRQQMQEILGKDIAASSGAKTMMDLLKEVLQVFRYQIIHNAQPTVIDTGERERRVAAQRQADVDNILKQLDEFLDNLVGPNGKRLSDPTIEATIATIEDGLQGDLEAEATLVAQGLMEELGYIQILADYEDTLEDITLAIFNLDHFYKQADNPTQEGNKQRDDSAGFEDLLAEFLLIPETEFALPPTCNVIFPQDQTGFSLDRQLMQEPTRAISTPTSEVAPFELLLAPPALAGAVIPTRPIQAANANGYASPVPGKKRISSRFSKSRRLKSRHVNPEGKARPHEGIDIAVAENTPVIAIDDGKVIRAGWQDNFNKTYYDKKRKKTFTGKGFGLRVYIKHDNGLETKYAHLNALAVKEGQRVKRGQQIGLSGNTGTSTGPHLHFETWEDGQPANPEGYLTIEGDYIVESPPPQEAEEPEVPQTEEKNILEAAPSAPSENASFNDWRYLTKEEQLSGIVPYFDMGTDRAHAFMAFINQGADSKTNRLLMLNAQFELRRFQTRSLSALTGPFNPNPIAGFPGLVVDRIRSLIGMVSSVSHAISVGGGQGNASTTVQISHPRYWDEGDPYYWKNGEENQGDDNPFPVYYLTKLLGTNSSPVDFWWEENLESWNFQSRPVDYLYRDLLGPDVRGIPYQFATRDTTRGARVAYNKAIDARLDSIDLARANKDTNWRGKSRNVNTIVGRYYYLVDNGRDGEEAEKFVQTLTKRRGVTERYLMSNVLKAKTQDNGFSYGGGPFRAVYQEVILRMNEILAQTQQFRG